MGPNDVLSKGLVADTAIPKYHAVTLSGTEHCSVANAAGELVIGICQEEIVAQDVTDGRVAAVQLMGISVCIAGAAIAQGAEVATAADGRVVTAVTGNRVLGVATVAAANAGDWVTVMLTPAGRVV